MYMVPVYCLLKERGIDDVINIFLFLYYGRFHVAVRLFRNRSQMTSNCGKNTDEPFGYRLVCYFRLLTTF